MKNQLYFLSAILFLCLGMSDSLYCQDDEHSGYDTKILKFLSGIPSIENTYLEKDSFDFFFCKDQTIFTLKSLELATKKFRVDSLAHFYDSIKMFPCSSQLVVLHAETYREFYPVNRTHFYNTTDSLQNNKGIYYHFSNLIMFENLSIERIYISIPRSNYFATYYIVFNKEKEIIHSYGDMGFI